MFERRHNINTVMVLKVLGWLLILEAVMMLVPVAVSAGYQEYTTAKEILYAVLITGAVGALMTTLLRPRSTEMNRKEGFLLTALVWVLFSLFGMLPFLFTGALKTVADAYFETMSGFTTTGATMCSAVESLPHGVLLWRALIQWIGGMGIILFTLAVLPMLNHQGGIQLFNAEVSGITHDKLRPRISETAKSLWMVYIVLSVIMIILLWIGPMNLFDAVCQTFAALSTGGFSTRNASVGGWHSNYVNVVIIVFMFIGGMNFSLLYTVSHGKLKALLKNDIFRWYLGIVVVATLLCFMDMWLSNPKTNIEDGLIACGFEVVSGLSSTGFVVADLDKWNPFSVMIISLLMVSCACAGSTTGGAKIDRMVVLLKNVKNELSHAIRPNLVTTVKLNDRVITYETVQKILAFLCIYALILLVSTTIITAYKIPILDSMFMSLSALGNVGYGYGVTTGGLYSNLPDLVKWLLSLDMLMGRLELFTVLILFTKGFWTK